MRIMVDESRRKFLKKSASLAGVAVAVPLMPEEKVDSHPLPNYKDTPPRDFSTNDPDFFENRQDRIRMNKIVQFNFSYKKVVLRINKPVMIKHVYMWENYLRRNVSLNRKYMRSLTGIFYNFFELDNSTKMSRKSINNLRLGGIQIGEDKWCAIRRVNNRAGRMWVNGKAIRTGQLLIWGKDYVFESEESGKRKKVDILGMSGIDGYNPIVATAY